MSSLPRVCLRAVRSQNPDTGHGAVVPVEEIVARALAEALPCLRREGIKRPLVPQAAFNAAMFR